MKCQILCPQDRWKFNFSPCVNCACVAEDQGLHQAQGQDLELAIALMQADGSSAALEKVAVTVVQQYEAVIRAQHPNIQPEKLEKFNAYLLEEFLNLKPELLHIIAGLYAQYLTTEEIRQLLAFYQTDLGKKSVEAGLQMQEKVYALTFQWGRTGCSTCGGASP